MELSGAVIGNEARGLHNRFIHAAPEGGVDPRRSDCNGCGITIYSPNLNLVRDPRWGRAQETFGEDPTLTARLLVPFVQVTPRPHFYFSHMLCILRASRKNPVWCEMASRNQYVNCDRVPDCEGQFSMQGNGEALPYLC